MSVNRANVLFFLDCLFVFSVALGIILFYMSVIPPIVAGIATAFAGLFALVLTYLQLPHAQGVLNTANKKLQMFFLAIIVSPFLILILILLIVLPSNIRNITISTGNAVTSSSVTKTSISIQPTFPHPTSIVTPTTQSDVPSPTPNRVLYIPSPGCSGDNSLQNSSNIVFNYCPNQGANTPNFYNDFGAGDEVAAQTDTSGQSLTITGTVNIEHHRFDCSKECIFTTNVFFHDEQTNYRQGTVIGIAVDGYGIGLDRNGNAYSIRSSQGIYNLTSLTQLPNFPIGNDLLSDANPVNIQIVYSSHQNLSFKITYKTSVQSETALTSAFGSEVLSSSINPNNPFQVFEQNKVTPANYPEQFKKDLKSFGDSSIIGLGEVEVMEMH